MYQIHWGADRFEAGLRGQIERLGARPDYVMFFNDLRPERGFPAEAAEICRRFGAIPVVSQELWRWGDRRTGEGGRWLGAIARGRLDGYWREWAEGAAAFGAPVILRFGFEMNGDWFPWGGRPEAFVAAWRQVWKIVREAGADNVLFLFSPNVVWDPEREETRIPPYHPGDAFVDLLGLDGYNFGDGHSPWHRWQSYEEVFGASVATMARWPQPLLLAEVGCADDPRKAAWLAEFLEAFRADDRLAGFIYFNHHNPRKNEPDWRLESDPRSLEAFRSELAGPGRD